MADNRLAELGFGLQDGVLLISGMVGSVVPIALVPTNNLRRALGLVFVGFAVSFFVTPLICHMLGIDNAKLSMGMGFLVGMLGVKVAQSIIDYADKDTLQSVLAKIVANMLGGNVSSSDKKSEVTAEPEKLRNATVDGPILGGAAYPPGTRVTQPRSNTK